MSDRSIAMWRLNAAQRTALRQRLIELARVFGLPTEDDNRTPPELARDVCQAMAPLDPARAWLLEGVIAGRLPVMAEVQDCVRTAELDGVEAAFRAVVRRWSADPDEQSRAAVTIVTDQVLVDVHHTAQVDFATGIQRVTREVARRWWESDDVLLVGWRADLSGMRVLTAPERARAFHGGPAVPVPNDAAMVIPWRCTYVVPELAAEVRRAERLLAMAASSETTLQMIGHDLVPVTTAETSHSGLTPGFARNLAAARHARTIAPVSEASADEYRGWVKMLTGSGLPGPVIEPVLLPAEAPPAQPGQVERAAQRLLVGSLPLVLVVGSHEPRKNHLTVLHAAEILWREGYQFSLTFVGGNSWNSGAFTATLDRLAAQGRPVETISAASDDLLWGGYRVARFTVFPSINEGFGLPVAESLACGTPVVTSKYGAMKEIADQGGGAVLVDPRNDSDVAAGMRALLETDGLIDQLRSEAAARPNRTWDDYAAETWTVFLSGARRSGRRNRLNRCWADLADPPGEAVRPHPRGQLARGCGQAGVP
jgi:glycosyltransferase involved in cell wall biosynthesis